IDPQCFVWDAEYNQYAQILKNDGSPASFPCNVNDISDWINSTESIGEDLYYASGCGDSSALVSGCPEWCVPHSTTSCDTSATSETNCPDENGNSPLINTAQTAGTCEDRSEPRPGGNSWWLGNITRAGVIKAWLGPMRYRLRLDNNISGYSALRTERTWLSEWDWMSAGVDHYTEESELNSYQLFTPLGKIAEYSITHFNSQHHNHPSSHDFSGEWQDESTISRRPFDYVYGERIIAQLYSIEILKHTLHRPCGLDQWNIWWVGGDYYEQTPCDYDIDEYTLFQEFKVFAQVDLVDDATNTDPRTLPRNSSFENAIKSLHTRLTNISPDPPEGELLPYGFQMEIRAENVD
ncbi:MAG: hypothetical protein GY864_04280, partial [Desulfobacterales bacterium]|nr:hypothetical protein [Desulfobacterales bacterium]